jgi:hypothetical protein
VWLARAAREVAGLLKQDVERLLVVLQGVDPGYAARPGPSEGL